MRQGGFSLIEVLVVIAILALLLGLSFASTGKQQRSAQVQQQAELLAATLRRARSLAMSNQAVYAVAFHIQNQPGSSGAVLNNRSGGHGYRLLGPAPSLATVMSNQVATSDLQGRIPYAGGGGDFQRVFLRELASSWADEPHMLPAGRVRFLALGDTDEGPAIRGPTLDAATVHYGSGGETTYPRPWFGYYDAVAGRLWPWGGYDSSKRYSAFFYQGIKEGPITDSVHPVTRTYNGQDILVAGEPRAVVNADWLDAGIAFLPDGRAYFLEWNRSRRYYADRETAHTTNGNGVRDMAKVRKGYNRTSLTGLDACFTLAKIASYNDQNDFAADIPEVGHFDRHLGGWHITLAPDVRDDRTEFPDAKTALASMMPMHRVFIGKNGSIRTFPVRQVEGYIAGKTMWPADPAAWLVTSNSAGSNPVWQHCRLGWLHVVNAEINNAERLVPRGRPVVDAVDPAMLSQRQWWFDE